MTAVQDLVAIRELEDLRYAAILGGDLDQFEALSHPELAYTHSSGETDTLGTYLEKCRSGFYVYESVEHPIDEIKIVGDVAIVLGEMNASLTVANTPKTLRNRCMAVWVNTFEGWRFLAYQPTPLPAK